MTDFLTFIREAKLRHDFDDQIMVRYVTGGEHYDTWVSGDEVEQRLRSETREQQLRGLNQLALDDLRTLWDDLRANSPEMARTRAEQAIRERLAAALDEAIGGNLIGDGLANAVRGGAAADARDRQKQHWQSRLQAPAFRAKALELAWLNLRGSFPPEDRNNADRFDDWT
jgi:hypothetical protein